MICVFGLTMAIFACIWNAIGIDLGWLFLVMGLVIGGAVFPTAFAITWTGQTKAGAISGCLLGLASGLTSWLVTANKLYGPLSVATTGMEYPTLAGNMAAVIIGGTISIIVSLIWPDDAPFDWEITRAINTATPEVNLSSPIIALGGHSSGDDSDVKDLSVSPATEPTPTSILPQTGEEKFTFNQENETNANKHEREQDEEEKAQHFVDEDPHSPALKSALRLAWWASSLLTLIMLVLVPIPMFLSHYIFSEGFFVAWVVVSFIWVFGSAATSIILPVVETRGFFVELGGKIWGDLRRGRGR